MLDIINLTYFGVLPSLQTSSQGGTSKTDALAAAQTKDSRRLAYNAINHRDLPLLNGILSYNVLPDSSDDTRSAGK